MSKSPVSPESNIESAIVGICAGDHQSCGTGFLIGERLVLTCAHVVTTALRLPENFRERPRDKVSLYFLIAAGNILKANVIFWQPFLLDGSGDIAGLEIIGEIPNDVHPIHLLKAENIEGHPFRAFGFPRSKSQKDEVQLGHWVLGSIHKLQTTGWIQIESVVDHGFSGSPVWDENLHVVVGMVNARKRFETGQTAAYMIPTKVMLKAWPELVEVLFQNLQMNWFEWLAAEQEKYRENL